MAYTFGTLALLFQPFYKIALGRTVWNIVDVIVAIGLIVLFLWERRGRQNVAQERQPSPIEPDGVKVIKVEPVENNRFEFGLEGKLAPKELIYVASEDDKALTDLFESQPEVLDGWGQMIGFHIVYLPLLMKRLSDKRVLQYRAPYLNEAELAGVTIGNDFLLQYLSDPTDKSRIKQGFIRTEDIHRGSDGKDKAINRFYPLSSKNGEPLTDQLHRIGKQISAETNRQVYSELRPLGLSDKAIQSIEDVTNPLLNSINEKCARIRGAFVGRFDNYMAKNYYVDGLRGEAKKISLPRNLVVWE